MADKLGKLSLSKALFKHKVHLLLLTVGFVVAGSIGYIWWFADDMTQPELSEQRQTTASAGETDYLDRSFVKQMLVHNEQAVLLFDHADRLPDPDPLKQIIRQFEATREIELVEFQTKLKSWGEPYVHLSEFPQQSGHDMYPTFPGMATPEDIELLNSQSGAELSVELQELIVTHIDGARLIAESHGKITTTEFIRDLTRTIEETRTNEAGILRANI